LCHHGAVELQLDSSRPLLGPDYARPGAVLWAIPTAIADSARALVDGGGESLFSTL